ncbi:hypothetical protein CEXT_674941 [Caerostris extrusa]|uniref:Uncharacterized protein n=1 Tax=Caerostris extrusa TaxID=172846 RepID=A0AAV4MLK4_CAEEX|nr:hypothetical protein CEXT_674941 [Caerostris extrusa]
MAELEIALTCQNVSDFEAFDHILSEWFCVRGEHNFRYHFVWQHCSSQGFLSGLVVTQLIVDDFQTQMEEGAFEGCSITNDLLYKSVL